MNFFSFLTKRIVSVFVGLFFLQECKKRSEKEMVTVKKGFNLQVTALLTVGDNEKKCKVKNNGRINYKENFLSTKVIFNLLVRGKGNSQLVDHILNSN